MPASSLPNLPPRVWLALASATTAAVVYLSLGNAPQLAPTWLTFAGADKVNHALAYATLAVLWWLAFRQNRARGRAGLAGAAARFGPGQRLWGALFALGALLEVLQWGYYPARYFELADMLANGVGAALGCLAAARIFPT